MSGIVGAGTIRDDIQENLEDRIPNAIGTDLTEARARLELDLVQAPFNEARTTTVRTLDSFYTLLRKVLESARDYDGLEHPIRFTKEYPHIDAELPCFSVKLLSREPWEHNGRKELGPRYRTEYWDPDNPGSVIEEYIRRQKNRVQIKVMASTGKTCDLLANWVEDKIFEYMWAFQWGGEAHPLWFMGRGEDQYENVREQQIYSAPLLLDVMTMVITRKRSTALRKVSVNIGIAKPDGQ